MSISRFIYSVLLYLLLPVVLLRLFIKSRRNKSYRIRVKERLGRLPSSLSTEEDSIIWLHAVSVGETIAVKPLINQLLLDYPKHKLLITSTTPTGSATVKKLFAKQVLHCYFPYDLPHVIQRFIRQVKPQLLLIIETEIWPNLYAACHHNNIPLLLLNARLSTQSMQHYLHFKALVSETLSRPKLIAVRSKEDQQHFLSLGAPPERLKLVGNIKFDISIDNTVKQQGLQLKRQWGKQRLVWIAASTHAGEDEKIILLFKQLKQHFPTLLLIIVPRHPERFDTVYQLIVNANFQVQKRSDQVDFHPNTEIILGDSMGEMLLWYATADIAFIGGSLVKTGGHNPLEAIILGVPVISGRYIFNFNDIYPPLCAANIAWVEPNTAAIRARIIKCLTPLHHHSKKQYPKQLPNFKQQCTNFMQQHQGVIEKLRIHIKKHL
jgi:3-deoxy-D-manno-octulosonic-acid transferase